MKKETILKLIIISCIILFFLRVIILKINNNNSNSNSNSNSNMKLIFVGDCMFGRNGNPFSKTPFINVESLFKEASHIFLNLETTISNPLLNDNYKEDKVFNYQSTGEHLLSLKDITKKPIFTAIVNNHTLDYGLKGLENTKKFLRNHKFIHTVKQKAEHNNVVFLNATDHCGCNDPKFWGENVIMIDYNNLEPIYQKIKNISDKFIVFSIHWGPNWVKGEMDQKIKNFGRKLIENGVNIVFGHSSHHIVDNPIEEYKGGIIIYGLGDFINDYVIKPQFKSDKALICVINKKGKKLSYETIEVKRNFVKEGGSIPFLQ